MYKKNSEGKKLRKEGEYLTKGDRGEGVRREPVTRMEEALASK